VLFIGGLGGRSELVDEIFSMHLCALRAVYTIMLFRGIRWLGHAMSCMVAKQLTSRCCSWLSFLHSLCPLPSALLALRISPEP